MVEHYTSLYGLGILNYLDIDLNLEEASKFHSIFQLFYNNILSSYLRVGPVELVAITVAAYVMIPDNKDQEVKSKEFLEKLSSNKDLLKNLDSEPANYGIERILMARRN
ncbi:MAG: hypothetical protein AABW45_00505 [Nanoarchaeota archaeon]